MISLSILFISLLIYIVFKLIHTYVEYVQTSKCLSSIPGPNIGGLLGDLAIMSDHSSDDFYSRIQSLAQVYKKDGLLKLRFGNKFIVCVFAQRHLGNLLSSSENIRKSTEYSFLNDWLEDGLLISDGSKWKQQRKVLTTEIFHRKNNSHFLEIINRIGNEHFVEHKIDPEKNIAIPIIRALTNCLFHSDFESISEVEEYFFKMHYLASKFPERALSPLLWPKWIYKHTKTGREFYEQLDELNRMTLELLNNSTSDEGRNNFLPAFGRRESELLHQMNTFLFAGHDTTGLVLTWILYYLARFPEYQNEVYNECSENIKDIHNIENTELTKLVLLEDFIKEVLRLHPPVPMIGREITEQMIISNHTIPVGTMVYVLIDQIQLEGFQNPKKFDPKRKLNSDSYQSTPTMMAFSAGPRNCVGKNIAWILMKVFTAKILLKFRLEAPEIDINHTKYNITMAPAEEIKLKFIPRE